MTTYDTSYPWAKIELLRETSGYTNHLCEACVKGKQVKISLRSKHNISTKIPLELIHLDLFGPTKT